MTQQQKKTGDVVGGTVPSREIGGSRDMSPLPRVGFFAFSFIVTFYLVCTIHKREKNNDRLKNIFKLFYIFGFVVNNQMHLDQCFIASLKFC